MSWWDDLHPEEDSGKKSCLGVPIPLDCSRALPGEPVLIKNGFDGFHATKLHEILQQKGVKTLVIIGLITRFSSDYKLSSQCLVRSSIVISMHCPIMNCHLNAFRLSIVISMHCPIMNCPLSAFFSSDYQLSSRPIMICHLNALLTSHPLKSCAERASSTP